MPQGDQWEGPGGLLDSLSKPGEAQSDALCVADCRSLHPSLLIVEFVSKLSD